MYRTLLVQILKRIPRHQQIFARLHEDWIPPKGLSWPTPKLEELLNIAVQNLDGRPVAFYVDALDECDKHEIRQMIQVFANLIEKASSYQQTVRVCFGSRPYPGYKTRSAIYLDLSHTEEQQQDICAYVDAHLHIGSNSVARKTRKRLLSVAQGVFLWVKLVVDRLNDEYSAGRPDLYGRWLRRSFGELQLLYKDMLQRGHTDENEDVDESKRQAAIVCSLVYGMDDFTPRQLVYMIDEALNKDHENKRRRWRSMDEATMRRYISNVSYGLLECAEDDRSGDTHVQFIHETARSFMFSGDVLLRLLDLGSLPEVASYHSKVMWSVCDRT
jgi:hypothetical protein